MISARLLKDTLLLVAFLVECVSGNLITIPEKANCLFIVSQVVSRPFPSPWLSPFLQIGSTVYDLRRTMEIISSNSFRYFFIRFQTMSALQF